ncbi:hypothetical protein Vadar_034664 [Vaccinium darrowii]|uniref:Uncharacterized protein n=1 Tax=Vaccinium darrowii TaxID=229202 RepID=A0ACB7Z849_9ERIC|nr:hypothetical protein Vadar_034664 [Vaccinium darrowii]
MSGNKGRPCKFKEALMKTIQHKRNALTEARNANNHRRWVHGSAVNLEKKAAAVWRVLVHLRLVSEEEASRKTYSASIGQDEASRKTYSVSIGHFDSFGALIYEESSNKIEGDRFVDGKVVSSVSPGCEVPAIREEHWAKPSHQQSDLLPQGRPKGVTPKYSLKPLVPRLFEFLGVEVKMANDCIGEEVGKMVAALQDGSSVLLQENVMFLRRKRRTILHLQRS